MIDSKIKNAIKNKSLESIPNECCGFVLNNNEIVFCENSSSNPTKEFSIKSEEFLKNIQKGIKLVFHSHPNGSEDFSVADKIYHKQYDLPLLVYSVKYDKFNLLIEDTELSKYENEDYDCLGFVKCYMEEKLNIKIDTLLSRKNINLMNYDKKNISFENSEIEEIMREIKFEPASQNQSPNNDIVIFKKLNIFHMGIVFEKYILHKTRGGINLTDQLFIKKEDYLKCYRYAG